MTRLDKQKFGFQFQILKKVFNFLQGNEMTLENQCNFSLDTISSKGIKTYKMQQMILILVGCAMRMRNPPFMSLQNVLQCKHTDGRYFNASQLYLIHLTGQLIKSKNFLKYLHCGVCLKIMNNHLQRYFTCLPLRSVVGRKCDIMILKYF